MDDGEQQLKDGKADLEDAKPEVLDGKEQLESAKAEAADGRAQLESAKTELAEGRTQLESAKAEAADGRAQLGRDGHRLGAVKGGERTAGLFQRRAGKGKTGAGSQSKDLGRKAERTDGGF